MKARETLKVEDLETEVVVIGGGGVGLAAAIAAREKGADVIILEKRRTLGGNAAIAGGIFAVESHIQKRWRGKYLQSIKSAIVENLVLSIMPSPMVRVLLA